MSTRSLRHRSLALRLLEVMGLPPLAALAITACGGKVFVDPANGAGGSDGSGGSASVGGSGGAGGDLPCPASEMQHPKQVCMASPGEGCFAESSAINDAIAAALGLCNAIDHFFDCCDKPSVTYLICPGKAGPKETCCYEVATDPMMSCASGRPFVVEGAARVAGLRRRADWSSPRAATIDALDPVTRAALAAAWAREACFEHASVASFARLALELLAVGAPPSLVRDAQRAMGEEIHHAELCFALAGGYAGEPVGPGPIPMDGALERASHVTLATLAAAAVREGCIGETIAALVAQEARARAQNPAVRAALDVIAADETEHAAMSWRLVAWAYREGPAEVRGAIAAAFAEGVALPDEPLPIGADAAALRAHGRLPGEDVRAVAASALAEVIRPSAAALLAS